MSNETKFEIKLIIAISIMASAIGIFLENFL
ncbi:hypothetical protein UGMREWDR_CDS0066 [Aeromonas phage GomatiRiver_11]|nr:hypothetical protein UGMREWDR_CDS0066 [Aeromonas phage GomatiRiver_11]